MINMSLEKGIVPENWKLALVDHRLKKLGMDLVFENFRPVNNLHFLAKVAEKVVMSQLVNHCNENAPLPVCQSAYRQFHSTETALLKVQNDILINMDNEEVTLLVMLDMSAAFDTIDHNILIDILKNNFGVVDSALQWFRSYLANRKQQVYYKQLSNNYSLRSDELGLLHVPSTHDRKSFGDRAFLKAGPTLWNLVPCEIRLSPSLDSFKTNLKTFLYRDAYINNTSGF
jgi:hypothetical protein